MLQKHMLNITEILAWRCSRNVIWEYSLVFHWGNFPNISRYDIGPNRHLPAQVNNRNTRSKCEICSKLTINTPE